MTKTGKSEARFRAFWQVFWADLNPKLPGRWLSRGRNFASTCRSAWNLECFRPNNRHEKQRITAPKQRRDQRQRNATNSGRSERSSNALRRKSSAARIACRLLSPEKPPFFDLGLITERARCIGEIPTPPACVFPNISTRICQVKNIIASIAQRIGIAAAGDLRFSGAR